MRLFAIITILSGLPAFAYAETPKNTNDFKTFAEEVKQQLRSRNITTNLPEFLENLPDIVQDLGGLEHINKIIMDQYQRSIAGWEKLKRFIRI